MYLPLFTYFVLPDATSTISGVATWFNPWFAEIWPWLEIAIAISVVVVIARFVFSMFHKS